jgi:hypothetical protein
MNPDHCAMSQIGDKSWLDNTAGRTPPSQFALLRIRNWSSLRTDGSMVFTGLSENGGTSKTTPSIGFSILI